jgi:hypothetical protein
MIDNHFGNVNNGCIRTWHLEEMLEDESLPQWVREITEKVYETFKDDLTDGYIEVSIEW